MKNKACPTKRCVFGINKMLVVVYPPKAANTKYQFCKKHKTKCPIRKRKRVSKYKKPEFQADSLQPQMIVQRKLNNPLSSSKADSQDPSTPNSANMIEKECCGNFLIQGLQSAPIQLWQSGTSVSVNLSQVTIYSSPTSTGVVEVQIDGNESARLQVHPGNTAAFTGRNIRSISISATCDSTSYLDGKYVVSSFFEV